MSEQIFSDPIAQEYYKQGTSELETTQSADGVLRKADAFGQQDARADIMHAAFYYLAAAHFLEPRDRAKSAHAYHQAGHQLQRLAQLTQAARAYSNAGKLAEQAAQFAQAESERHHLQHFAVRSYSRANHCFAEVGELDLSETEYVNESNARVAWAKMQGKHPLALLAWKATSNYGTSMLRWGVWVLGTIVVFSLLYELFFRLRWLQPMSNTEPSAWVPLWSGLYYAINVTSSLALVEYQPTHPIAQTIVMLNVMAGYIFLGIGIGIIGQLIKRR